LTFDCFRKIKEDETYIYKSGQTKGCKAQSKVYKCLNNLCESETSGKNRKVLANQ